MPRARCLLAIFGLLAGGCSETFESHYADWQEAQASGIVERGWLPEWLPPSATNIREIHNLDTNAVAFSFSVPTRWTPPDTAGCGQLSQAAAPTMRLKHFPPNIEHSAGILNCGDLFLLVTERDVFAWR